MRPQITCFTWNIQSLIHLFYPALCWLSTTGNSSSVTPTWNKSRETQTYHKHTEINVLSTALRVQTHREKEEGKIFLFFLAFHKFLAIILKCRYSHHASVFFSPMMPSLLIVQMKLKCTGYLLIQLSCSVTGRINQSRGQLYAYVFQVHLRTSGYEITVLSSQIWSTNAVPLCHSNLRWRCYYVELSKVIKTVQKKEEKSSWTFLTASIYYGCSIPFSKANKNSTFPRSCCKMLSGHPVSVGT